MFLKKPVPPLARMAFASACIAALILAGSLASWAAQPGAGQPANDAAKTSIQLGGLENVDPSEDITYRPMSPPTYPPQAVAARIGAKVRLKVLIGSDGAVQSIDIDKIDLLKF